MRVVVAGSSLGGLSSVLHLARCKGVKHITLISPCTLHASDHFGAYYTGLWSPALRALSRLGLLPQLEQHGRYLDQTGYKTHDQADPHAWLVKPHRGLGRDPFHGPALMFVSNARLLGCMRAALQLHEAEGKLEMLSDCVLWPAHSPAHTSAQAPPPTPPTTTTATAAHSTAAAARPHVLTSSGRRIPCDLFVNATGTPPRSSSPPSSSPSSASAGAHRPKAYTVYQAHVSSVALEEAGRSDGRQWGAGGAQAAGAVNTGIRGSADAGMDVLRTQAFQTFGPGCRFALVPTPDGYQWYAAVSHTLLSQHGHVHSATDSSTVHSSTASGMHDNASSGGNSVRGTSGGGSGSSVDSTTTSTATAPAPATTNTPPPGPLTNGRRAVALKEFETLRSLLAPYHAPIPLLLSLSPAAAVSAYPVFTTDPHTPALVAAPPSFSSFSFSSSSSSSSSSASPSSSSSTSEASTPTFSSSSSSLFSAAAPAPLQVNIGDAFCTLDPILAVGGGVAIEDGCLLGAAVEAAFAASAAAAEAGAGVGVGAVNGSGSGSGSVGDGGMNRNILISHLSAANANRRTRALTLSALSSLAESFGHMDGLRLGRAMGRVRDGMVRGLASVGLGGVMGRGMDAAMELGVRSGVE